MTPWVPILYLSFADVLGEADKLEGEKKGEILAAWVWDVIGEPLCIGSIEVGRVTSARIDERGDRVALDIGWGDNIDVAVRL